MAARYLSEMDGGEKGRVTHIGLAGDIRRRLMDMGLVPGSEVEMVRVAPLGDPIDIRVKGYDLSLRKEIASKIGVEVEDMPLAVAPWGKTMTVVGFRGGMHMRRRLADMGLTPGVAVRVTSGDACGPVIIELRGSKIALGRGMARHVLVRESKDACQEK